MKETNLPNTFFKAGIQFLIVNSYLNLNENIALEVAKKRKKLGIQKAFWIKKEKAFMNFVYLNLETA